MVHVAKRNPNRCPIHPGALLREDAIPATGKTKAEIAQLLGTYAGGLRQVARGTRRGCERDSHAAPECRMSTQPRRSMREIDRLRRQWGILKCRATVDETGTIRPPCRYDGLSDSTM
jgi:hypothetical protein